jgi:HEAT repeat protein
MNTQWQTSSGLVPQRYSPLPCTRGRGVTPDPSPPSTGERGEKTCLPTRCAIASPDSSAVVGRKAALLLVTACAFLIHGRILAAAPDPVDNLRHALQELPAKLADQNSAIVLKYREAQLKKYTDAIKGLNNLRRALVLKEWQDNRTVGRSQLCDVDLRYRVEIGKRFIGEVDSVIKKDNATAHLAAANLIGEMGANVRALDMKDRHGFARSLTPQLTELFRTSKDSQVRQAALRALGQINPQRDKAAEVLAEGVRRDQVEERRAAAEAIINMILVPLRINRLGTDRESVEITGQDVIDTCVAMVPVAGLGLDRKETDAQVCRSCAEALQHAATALNYFIPEPFLRNKLPPPGRERTELEEKEYQVQVKEVKAERHLVAPLVNVLAQQGKGLTRSLDEPNDTEVRLASCRALEYLASARYRLMRRVADMPDATILMEGQKRGTDYLGDELLRAVEPALPRIGKRLQGREEVRVRRAAVDFLESLEDASLPALPILIGALKDDDLIVRWSAARTLGKLEPAKAAVAVPALADRLDDPDLDVRMAVAGALEAYGPVAKSAVSALARTLTKGDVEFRVAALKALSGINGTEAATTVDTLIAMLKEPDTRIRAAAAQTLGTFGPLARRAEPALRRYLEDDDAAVRRAVSDALLNILMGPIK